MDTKNIKEKEEREEKEKNAREAEKEKGEEGEVVEKGVMQQYVENSAEFPEGEAIVEGTVIAIDLPRSEMYVDIKPFGTGIIYGREFMTARDIIKKITPGDFITAKIIAREDEDGYLELSLKEARAALVWSEAEDLMRSGEILRLVVKDANKGGLIIEWKGVQGFLPASQLGTEHYPRVEDGDKQKIQEELKALVGERVTVIVLTAVPKEGKLIFTEKIPAPESQNRAGSHTGIVKKDRNQIVEKYAVGEEVEGSITGIVDFGVFVKVEEGLEGLAHISELDWGLVEDPRLIFKVGEKVKAKIIDISNGKISLSIKALKENPWHTAKDKYNKGDEVRGIIIKYNKYGALASLEEGIAGLVHISEFGTEEKLRQALELGKTYRFHITHFDPKEQKMALSFGEKDEKKV